MTDGVGDLELDASDDLDAGSPDGDNAGSNADAEGDEPPEPVFVLEFFDVFSPNGQPCAGLGSCTVHVTATSLSLPVRLLRDGAPAGDISIHFEISEAGQDTATLVDEDIVTEDSGVARGSLQILQPVTSPFEVHVSVADVSVEPITFKLSPAQLDATLVIGFEYDGTPAFDGVRTYLFKNAKADEANILCADFDPLDLPTADLIKGPMQLSQTAKYPMLPGLEDEGEQLYTVLVRGERVDGTPMAIGCDDEHGHVSVTTSTYVPVTMHDIPPRVAGVYEVHTELDLVSALPDDAQFQINFLLSFFEKPSASLLLLSCDLDAVPTDELCALVFDDPSAPDIYALTTTGSVILARIDAVLAASVAEWTGYDILGVGEAIRDLLRALQLIARFGFLAEPDATGDIPASKARATWGRASFPWSNGGGAVIEFDLSELGMAAPEVEFPANISFQGDHSALVIEEHGLPLEFGRIVDAGLQKIVLPAVFGDDDVSLPAIDSYDRLIRSLLGGGQDCLNASPTEPDCCARFAEAVFAETGSASVADLTQACEDLAVLASTYLEQVMLQLDTEGAETLKLATKPGEPCKLADTDYDQMIDAWGKQTPAAERCTWDMQLTVLGTTNEVESNSFYGVRVW